MTYALPIALLVAFATFVTVHVALVAKLVREVRPWWPAVAALVVPPLAPLLAQRAHHPRWALAWLIALAAYVAMLSAGFVFAGT